MHVHLQEQESQREKYNADSQRIKILVLESLGLSSKVAGRPLDIKLCVNRGDEDARQWNGQWDSHHTTTHHKHQQSTHTNF